MPEIELACTGRKLGRCAIAAVQRRPKNAPVPPLGGQRPSTALHFPPTALKTPLQAATHSLRIFGPPVRGRWPLPEGGKLRRSLPAPYLRPPPKKCGAGAHAAPLAPLFWADLHAIASGAPRRGAVIALFGEAVRDHTDGPLCERWAAEAQLSPVCARRREMPTSSRRAHSLPERLRGEPGRGEGSTGHYSPV